MAKRKPGSKRTKDYRRSEQVEPKQDPESGSNLSYMQHDISRGFPRVRLTTDGLLQTYSDENLIADSEQKKQHVKESWS